jgi:hypothetical protein
MEDADPEVYGHAASLFNTQNLLSVTCWEKKEDSDVMVMTVVNELAGQKKRPALRTSL